MSNALRSVAALTFWTWANLTVAQTAEVVTIQNEQLTAKISHLGAELTSLKDNETGIEYLWQGDSAHWPRQSPNLFPIIGSLKNDEFFYEGQAYKLSQHGFALRTKFNLISQSEDRVTFSMTSGDKTLKVYPFQFEFRITFELTNRSLTVKYQVFNLDDKEMYFSIGGHPGFNCPIRSGENRSEYKLVFDQQENVGIHLREGRLRSGKSAQFLKNENTIPITGNLFDNGALIFSNLKSKSIQINRGDERILTVHFDGFSNLGIWSSGQSSPFVCIEPWFGMTDPSYTDQNISKKEGIVTLPAWKEFVAAYSIEL